MKTDNVIAFSIQPSLMDMTHRGRLRVRSNAPRADSGHLPGVRSVGLETFPLFQTTRAATLPPREASRSPRAPRRGPHRHPVPITLDTGNTFAVGRELTEADGATAAEGSACERNDGQAFLPGKESRGMHFAFGGGNKTVPDN